MSVLGLLTLLLMAAVAYAMLQEGLVGAFTTCFGTVIAGMLAFQFWPMMATALEPLLRDTFLNGFEDALVLVLVFCLSLLVLRFAALSVTKRREFGFQPVVNQVGGIVFGLLTGYLVAGFLTCVFQTLPWHENFLGFQYDENGFAARSFPPDQIWLKLMQKQHRGAFDTDEDHANILQEFSKIYAKERRYNENREQPPAPAPPTPKTPPSNKSTPATTKQPGTTTAPKQPANTTTPMKDKKQ